MPSKRPRSKASPSPHSTTRTIAVLNQKGGVGKTTLAVNLGAALAARKQRVLLLDLDPQASASAALGVHDSTSGLRDALLAGTALADLIRPCGGDASPVERNGTNRLDLIPSSIALAGIERTLAGEVGAELVLRRQLPALLRGGAPRSDASRSTSPPARYDYVLVDCPPSLGLLAIAALAAVREVFVPVEAHPLALLGLAHLVQTVEVVRERLNPDVAITAVILSRVMARQTLTDEVSARLREAFPKALYATRIRNSVRLAEAPSHGLPIQSYDPKGAGAEDFRALAVEVLARHEG